MVPPWRDTMHLVRKIKFYRLVVLDEASAPKPYPVLDVLADLRALLGTDDRYLVQGERVTFCVPEPSPHPPRLRLLNVRRNNLPQIESAGILSPLLLDPESGLAEPIHLVFFDSGVVGSEFNFYGARPGRFAEFVRNKSVGPRIAIQPLYREDAVRRLDEMQDLRMAQLKVKRGAAALVRRADATLADALDQTERWAAGVDVDLVLRRPARSGQSLPERIRTAFRALAGSDELRSQVTKMRLEGRNPHTGEFEVLDLLEQELVTTRRILRSDERIRALDSNATYEAIQSAYAELEDEILHAGVLS